MRTNSGTSSPVLKRANGEAAGRIIELKPDRVVIGQSPESCHIVLDSRTVSRQHAEIYRKGDEFYLADLTSQNGTTVNNTRVVPGIDHRLDPADRINIFGVEFLYYPRFPSHSPTREHGEFMVIGGGDDTQTQTEDLEFEMTSEVKREADLLNRLTDPADHKAWEKFIDRYGPMIRCWCHHWFPREADERAHDVICELVFRMKTLEYKPAEGRFEGWLKTFTHNMMAKLKREERPLPAPNDDSLLDSSKRVNLTARLAAEFDLELLEQAKDRVHARVQPHTWAAYVATAEEHRKPAEVAHELGMRVGEVFQAKLAVINRFEA